MVRRKGGDKVSEKRTWQVDINISGIFTFESDVDFDAIDEDEANDRIWDIFIQEEGENQLNCEIGEFWPVNTPLP